MIFFMVTFWLLALAGLGGSALLLFVAAQRLLFTRYRELLKPAATSERRWAWAALVAAVLGCVGLFVLPVYVGSSCSTPLPVPDSGPSFSAPVDSLNIPVSPCPARYATFLQVNGPQVIPLFMVPVLFAMLPLALLRQRFRGLVFAVCAFLLAGHATIGMSGYGLAFAPSSVFLVVAGFFGIFGRSAQQGAPAGRSTAARFRVG